MTLQKLFLSLFQEDNEGIFRIVIVTCWESERRWLSLIDGRGKYFHEEEMVGGKIEVEMENYNLFSKA